MSSTRRLRTGVQDVAWIVTETVRDMLCECWSSWWGNPNPSFQTVHTYIHMHVYIYIYIYMHTYIHPVLGISTSRAVIDSCFGGNAEEKCQTLIMVQNPMMWLVVPWMVTEQEPTNSRHTLRLSRLRSLACLLRGGGPTTHRHWSRWWSPRASSTTSAPAPEASPAAGPRARAGQMCYMCCV